MHSAERRDRGFVFCAVQRTRRKIALPLLAANRPAREGKLQLNERQYVFL